MASSSAQSSADQGPWISMRRAFRSFQQQRFSGSYKKKHISKRNSESGDHPVTTYSLRMLDTFRSSDQISSPNAKTTSMSSTDSAIECPLCMQILPADSFFTLLTCQHRSCLTCLKAYLRIEITEGRVGIACPECPIKLHQADIRKILCDDLLMQKYEDFMLRHVLVLDPDTRWCPAPDCSYAVIASGHASCPQLTCERPGCGTLFCYHCKQIWHPNQTCDAARAERSSGRIPISPDLDKEHGAQSTIKACPRCGSLIMKLDDGSCNHMTCVGCGAEFCWLCLREISDLHYLSPSGCTFWGKKPWSRKRKILWQLGMLMGAPVGISLIAGVAFPVIIIGLPIVVGRKLLAKCRHMAKRKRHLVVASGVIASTLVSPVLAAVAVGVGVPMLLAYVYGVVPVSLCRDSCCAGHGQKQTSSEFEFDLKDMQDFVTGDHKRSSTLPSVSPSVGHSAEEAFPKTTSTCSISQQTLCSSSASSSSASRIEVQAEVSCDLARHGNGNSSSPVQNVASCHETGIAPTTSCASQMGQAEAKPTSDDRNLSKNCLGGVSISDASLDASSSGTCSFSATKVVECTGANSSSSSESVRLSLSFRRGRKAFVDSSGSHGATCGASCHVKSFKRQSMSVGDSIDEKVEAEHNYLSLHSLAEEDTCLESFAGGSDIVAMVAVSEETPNSDSHGKSRGVKSSASMAAVLGAESNEPYPSTKALRGTTESAPTNSDALPLCGAGILTASDISPEIHDIQQCDSIS